MIPAAMNSTVRLARTSLAILASLALPLLAQDNTSEKQAPTALTTADPAISVSHLELRLEPLTKAELATEAEAWRNIVKANVQEMSEAQIDASNARRNAHHGEARKLQKVDTARSEVGRDTLGNVVRDEVLFPKSKCVAAEKPIL